MAGSKAVVEPSPTENEIRIELPKPWFDGNVSIEEALLERRCGLALDIEAANNIIPLIKQNVLANVSKTSSIYKRSFKRRSTVLRANTSAW